MLCPLCHNELKIKADNEFFVCSRCGAYVKDKAFYIKPTEEKSRYEEHNNDVNDTHYQQFARPVVNLVLENFTPAHPGLDYGCGTGPVIAKMLEDKSYQVTRYDPFFYPDERYLNHRYDFICSCEVFEHFHQPKHEIQKLRALLKPNGWMIVMTHIYTRKIDFKRWYYRKDPTHIFIYTEKTLEYIAEHFNLSVDIFSERLVRFKKCHK
jgi:SAM-dependent methyltransferase